MLQSRPRKNLGFIAHLFRSKSDKESQPSPTVKPETLVRLRELCAKHTFVDVSFSDRQDHAYQSLIIKVDVDSQSLLIDELYPLQTNMNIGPGEHIEITSCGKGLPVKFSSTITAIEMHEGSPAYRIALPRKVKANQRREFFRVSTRNEAGFQLRIPLTGGGSCNVLDLSSSGIGFRVDKNISEQLRAHRIIEDARLTLPDNTVVYCDIEVRSFEYRKPPQRCTLVGATLLDIARPAQKQLDKLLIRLQREQKKH